MKENDEPIKTVAILLLKANFLSVSQEKWRRVAETLAARLRHPVACVDLEDDPTGNADLLSTIEWYAAIGFRRFVLIPLGLQPLDLELLLTIITWMRSAQVMLYIHIGREWTSKDWVDALQPPLLEALEKLPAEGLRDVKERIPTLLLVSHGSSYQQGTGLELASFAYHFQQTQANVDVRFCFLEKLKPSLRSVMQKLDVEGTQRLAILPWRTSHEELVKMFTEMGSLHATELLAEPIGLAWKWNRFSLDPPEPIELLEHPGLLHSVLGFYLDALATRSVERYFSRDPDGTQSAIGWIESSLVELDKRIDAVLPSEYQNRKEEVDTQSMGTASIPSDQFGTVPWDEIWTSFCDLAMAGGPPHRGRLLEAISSEEVKKNMVAYERVVQEIERGIEMVTGLKTERAEALGWVGVACHDEAMAVWLMRAIIVENVMVRREGKTLYLPAGPDFLVKKQIKNVITSVAKTVHYWRAHLRLVERS